MLTANLLRRAEVARLLGIKESTVDYLVRKGRLPKPIRITAHDLRWPEDEINAALEQLRSNR